MKKDLANIAWFRDLSKDDIGIAGGKGANLAEMYNARFPIPPGFIVTAQAYKHFLDVTGIESEIKRILKNLDVKNNDLLQEASEKIQQLIEHQKMPSDIKEDIVEAYDTMNISTDVLKAANKSTLGFIKAGRDLPFVAVRSSATAEDLPSISKDEHILVKINGKPYYRPMHEIYDIVSDGYGFDIEIPSMLDNKLQWLKVSQVYKHKAKDSDKLYKIKTVTGREIAVSPNHTLLVLDEDNLKIKEVKHISELKGNEKVPAINKLPLINLNPGEINILDYISGEDIIVKDNEIFIKNNSNNWIIQNTFSAKINLTKNFAYFLGLYCAEGSTYKGNQIAITNSESDILYGAIEFFKEIGIFKNQKINKNSIRVYSKTLVRFLHEICGKPSNIRGKGKLCYTKKVPEFVFGWSKELIGEFLKGCFDGDGSITKKGHIQYYSTSKMLVGGIIKLLEMLNIEWSLRKNKGEKWTRCFIIDIGSWEINNFNSLIGFRSLHKKERMLDFIAKGGSLGFPLKNTITISDHLSKKIRFELEKKLYKGPILVALCQNCNNKLEKSSKYRLKERFYCTSCHKMFYENKIIRKYIDKYVYYDSLGRFTKNQIPWNKGFVSGSYSVKKLKDLLNKKEAGNLLDVFDDSIKWDQIKEVQEIPYNDYVYDFSVPKSQNFAAGIGGIITHNSASFAGQQATFVNVRGKEDVVAAVQQCWASLFTARAIYYRVKNDFPYDKVLIAVVIQKMINSERSGIMFSANPATSDTSEIVIEAGFGLGDAIVSGSVNPDTYIIDKANLSIRSKKIAKQDWMFTRDQNIGRTIKKNLQESKGREQKLSDAEIKNLATYALSIEQHYQKPQDMEFALEGGKIYIVQSRPITTLKEKAHEEEITSILQPNASSGEAILTGLGASPGVASGRVKIVSSVHDLSKVEKGDVLVAKMTNPDYVPAMERAGAIVTSEGGVTCFSGDTKILTTKGFMTFSEAYILLESNISPKVLSFNPQTYKTEWKNAKNPIKRKSNLIKVGISQKGYTKENFLKITPDHKMVTFENRNIIKKDISGVINEGFGIVVANKIPENINPHIISEPKLFYLCGALFTDGNIKVDRRRGRVTFTQKETLEKQDFINTVRNYYLDAFNIGFYYKTVKNTVGNLRGRKIYGYATDFIFSRKEPALKLQSIKDNLCAYILHLDKESLISFLAGAIDGDGSYNSKSNTHRLHIYCGKKYLTHGLILALLRLGINYQVSKNRDACYNIQILDNLDLIFTKTKRVKGNPIKRSNGIKFFFAKQVLGDIIDSVNYKGRIKPYVKSNLLFDSNKIKKDVLPLVKNKNHIHQIQKILDSDIKMQRVFKKEELGINVVYNFEVEDNHTYVVFTENFTPVVAWNCHAAIVSRELGVPSVVGTEKATEVLHDGDLITVDGSHGKVYAGAVAVEQPKQEQIVNVNEVMMSDFDTVTKVKAIADLPHMAERVAKTNPDGIGLVRIEFMIAANGVHPAKYIRDGRDEDYINLLVHNLSEMAKHFEGKPIWVRTSDIRTDEYRELEGGGDEPHEANPMLGWHGIRRGLDDDRILKAEFTAIKRLHEIGYKNVGIMVPFLISVDELRRSKQICREVGLEPLRDVEFGVMVETPASVWVIDDLCKDGISFISFGTNDLTQTTLGVDRGNERLQKLYDEMNPAVLRSIEHVVKVCQKFGVKTSICGQAGSREDMAAFLVKIGIDSISANMDAVQKIKQTVAREEKKLILSVVRKYNIK